MLTFQSLSNGTLIGKWLKRAPDDSGKEKFRGILAAARRAGTGDPVPVHHEGARSRTSTAARS